MEISRQIFGNTLDIKDVNDAMMDHNRRGVTDFDGFSPADMYIIIHDPFNEKCAISINSELSDQHIRKSPLFNIVHALMELVGRESGVKLTPKGNLPRKVLKEIYAKGFLPDPMIDRGVYSLRVEEDWTPLHTVNLVLQLGGLTRKYNKKLVLTKKGKKLLEQQSLFPLFRTFLDIYCTQFNWGWNDRHPPNVAQVGFMFLIHLVRKYGDTFRTSPFYSDIYLKAFPMFRSIPTLFDDPVEQRVRKILEIRFLERFAFWFGFINLTSDNASKYHKGFVSFSKTELFKTLFESDN